MTPVTTVLLLCTANLCRSVMAQAMLSARLTGRDAPVLVTSAGTAVTPGKGGQRPPTELVSVLAARGVDVTRHRSRAVTADEIGAADLVLGMAREHIRHAAVLRPDAWPRAFTLRELVRRGRQAGVRGPGEPLDAWLARAADGRTRRDLLGRDQADDVQDPFGGPPAGYQAAANLLDQLTAELTALCWPAPRQPRSRADGQSTTARSG